MRTRLWVCVLVLAIAGTTAAQSKPDFSGRWVLVSPDAAGSDIPTELGVRESFEPPVTVMRVERRSKGVVNTDRYQIGLVGGVIGGSTANGPNKHTRFSVRWDGDKLVIETGTYTGPTRDSGPYSEHEEVWSLDAQGRLAMAVTDRASGTESRTIQLTYRRP